MAKYRLIRAETYRVHGPISKRLYMFVGLEPIEVDSIDIPFFEGNPNMVNADTPVKTHMEKVKKGAISYKTLSSKQGRAVVSPVVSPPKVEVPIVSEKKEETKILPKKVSKKKGRPKGTKKK